MLADQIASKLHWNTDEDEIRGWLSEQKGIAGAEADTLLALASQRQAAALRSKSLVPKLIATATLGIIASAAIPILLYGSMMSAFGPGHYQKSDTTMTLFISTIIFIGPIVCVWVHSKGSLILGGLILAPAFLGGLLLLIPAAIWYACAYSLWKKAEPVRPANAAKLRG